jgi:hypothetical protein
MALRLYGSRRDANESELVAAARKMGAKVWLLALPVDLLVLWRGRFHMAEVKLPAGPRGGTKDRNLTDDQETFRKEVVEAGGELLIWRTLDDVVRDLNRLPQQVDQR